VAISPDLGERYLDTVYQSNWVRHMYGPEAIDVDESAIAEPA
ncbi:2,3-diaminopropionate biosynthesis protein SbnA, partial [Streptomyces decoyicus]